MATDVMSHEEFTHIYYWKATKLRPLDRKGDACRVVEYGPCDSALIEFESDGLKIVVSKMALRRKKEGPQ